MNIRKNLSMTGVYPWSNFGETYVRGYIVKDNIVYRGVKFAQLISNINLLEELKTLLKCFDGSYCIICNVGNDTIVCTDIGRSFPLFYCEFNHEIILMDQLGGQNSEKLLIDSFAKKQLGSFHFTLNEQTLFEGVKQIPAGRGLLIGEDSVCLETICEFAYATEELTDINAAADFLCQEYLRVFNDVVRVLNGRTAVVPLSGGHDSRLVLTLLKKCGCKNIIAYSYGNEDNPESLIASRVAKQLKVPFYFINYQVDEFKEVFKSEGSEYIQFCSNASSTPCIQEWFAIYYLENKKIINSSCVIIPGYGGVLPGHYIFDTFVNSDNMTKDELIYLICCNFAHANHRSDYLFSTQEIKKLISGYPSISQLPIQFTTKVAAEAFERFVFSEEQSKFILNAVRNYEYYGFEWITPFFWGSQFLAWSKIANDLRYCNKAFFAMERLIYSDWKESVPFCGSKEIGFASTKNKELNFIQKNISRFNTYFRPRSRHYLNVIYPLRRYYYNLFCFRSTDINFFVTQETLEIYGSTDKLSK